VKLIEVLPRPLEQPVLEHILAWLESIGFEEHSVMLSRTSYDGRVFAKLRSLSREMVQLYLACSSKLPLV